MKTIIFFLSLFAVLLITACDKPAPPNDTTTNLTDTIAHDTPGWDNTKSIINIKWKLIAFVDTNGNTVKKVEFSSPEALWIYLNADTVNGRTVSNRLFGYYEINEISSEILIDVGRTKMGEIHSDGLLFYDYLLLVDSFSLQNNRLRLYYNSKQNYLLFERK